MGTPREDIRDTFAAAALEAAKAFGELVPYIHRGTTFNLWMLIGDETNLSELVLGADTTKTGRMFTIARQQITIEDTAGPVVVYMPDFIYDTFEKGDVIPFDDVNYVVSDGVKSDSVRAVYKVPAVRTHVRRLK